MINHAHAKSKPFHLTKHKQLKLIFLRNVYLRSVFLKKVNIQHMCKQLSIHEKKPKKVLLNFSIHVFPS